MFFGRGELGVYGTGSLRWRRGQRRLVATRWRDGRTLWRVVCVVLGRRKASNLCSLSRSWQKTKDRPRKGLPNGKCSKEFLGSVGVGYGPSDDVIHGDFPGGIRETIDGGYMSVPGNMDWMAVRMLTVPGFGCANGPEAHLVSKRLYNSRCTYELRLGRIRHSTGSISCRTAFPSRSIRYGLRFYGLRYKLCVSGYQGDAE